MSPSNIKKMSVRQLRLTFLKMMTSEWDEILEDRPDTDVKEAAITLLAIQRARIRLGNKQLIEIRNKLRANEQHLIQGKQDLEQALNNLQDFQRVIAATSAFLRIVGRVVRLAA